MPQNIFLFIINLTMKWQDLRTRWKNSQNNQGKKGVNGIRLDAESK